MGGRASRAMAGESLFRRTLGPYAYSVPAGENLMALVSVTLYRIRVGPRGSRKGRSGN